MIELGHRHKRPEAYGGAERKTGKDDGQREFMFQPVEGGANIFDFANAASVLAFAQAGAAEVEAEHGESEAIESFHGVEDNFVVQRSAVERMRMTNNGGMGGGGRAGIEQGFEASSGAGDGQRADGGFKRRH